MALEIQVPKVCYCYVIAKNRFAMELVIRSKMNCPLFNKH